MCRHFPGTNRRTLITVLSEPPGLNLLESRVMRKYQARFGGGRRKRGRKATAPTAHPTSVQSISDSSSTTWTRKMYHLALDLKPPGEMRLDEDQGVARIRPLRDTDWDA